MKNYSCPNCQFVVTYTGDKEKDVNCPMCYHKFITNKTTRVADFAESPVLEDPELDPPL